VNDLSVAENVKVEVVDVPITVHALFSAVVVDKPAIVTTSPATNGIVRGNHSVNVTVATAPLLATTMLVMSTVFPNVFPLFVIP
jgi:hypothetical protein